MLKMELQRFVLLNHVILTFVGVCCFGATMKDTQQRRFQYSNTNDRHTLPLTTTQAEQQRFVIAQHYYTAADEPRSGGYPKFPSAHAATDSHENSHFMRDTFYTARQCGTRSVNFDPNQYLRKGKIIGGTSTPYGAYPWQVEIQIFKPERAKFEHHCGGAVIGRNIVLTAAHCLQGPAPSFLRVVIGDHRLEERDMHERSYKVESVLLHPDFRTNGPYSNDIAIIKLKAHAGIGFNTHVRPICLPDPYDKIPVGTMCSVTGWGIQKAEDVKSLSSVLRVAAVPIMDTEMCRDTRINGGRYQKILDSMICAGSTDGGMDACQGDSGGPLACEYNDKFVLAGLVSWGDGCAKKNRPGVYTRVDSFIKWITDSIKLLE